MIRILTLLALLVFVVAPVAYGQIPTTISYQGVLTDNAGDHVPDGDYSMTFKIYGVGCNAEPCPPDAALYTEVHDGVSEPLVKVVRSGFSVVLGECCPLGLPFDSQYYLTVAVGADPDLLPRVKVTAAPYALNAKTVVNDAITSDKIAPETIMAADIAPGAVGQSEIATNAVTSVKIVNNTVTSLDIMDEPGTNYDHAADIALPPAFTDVVAATTTIQVPDGGYILVTISGYFAISHTVGNASLPRVSISEGAAMDFNSLSLYSLPTNAPTDTYYVPFSRSHAFAKAAAGSYTFSLIGNLFNHVGVDDPTSIGRPEIHAIYVPTVYGMPSGPNGPQSAGQGAESPDGR